MISSINFLEKVTIINCISRFRQLLWGHLTYHEPICPWFSTGVINCRKSTDGGNSLLLYFLDEANFGRFDTFPLGLQSSIRWRLPVARLTKKANRPIWAMISSSEVVICNWKWSFPRSKRVLQGRKDSYACRWRLPQHRAKKYLNSLFKLWPNAP